MPRNPEMEAAMMPGGGPGKGRMADIEIEVEEGDGDTLPAPPPEFVEAISVAFPELDEDRMGALYDAIKACK